MKSILFLLAKHVKLIMILYSTRKRSGRTCRISRLHQSAHVTKSELQSIEFQSTQIKNSAPNNRNPEHQYENELQTTFIQSTQIKKEFPKQPNQDHPDNTQQSSKQYYPEGPDNKSQRFKWRNLEHPVKKSKIQTN